MYFIDNYISIYLSILYVFYLPTYLHLIHLFISISLTLTSYGKPKIDIFWFNI